jgi:hypothetical protein
VVTVERSDKPVADVMTIWRYNWDPTTSQFERYDPEMAILGLSVLTRAPARPHKDQVGQNSIIFVRILNLTYPQTVVIRIVD